MNTKTHSLISPSGAHRWIRCPGSVEQEQRFEDMDSPYAAEGRKAHDLADMTLKNYINGDKTKWAHDFEGFPSDMADYVQEYVDYVLEHTENGKNSLCAEQTFPLDYIAPNMKGTVDAAVLKHEKKELHIFDFKYGAGVEVDAEWNEQGLLYATAFIISNFDLVEDLKHVVIHICQPRIGKGNYTSFKITLNKLNKWIEKEVKPLAMKIMKGEKNLPLMPGEKQCQFCKASQNGDCPALTKLTHDITAKNFEDLDVKSLPQNKKDQLDIFTHAPLVKKYINTVCEKLLKDALEGKPLAGTKLVEGQANRVWRAEAETVMIEELGEDEAFEKKLIGLGKAEKKLGKEFVNQWTIKPQGKPTLVLKDDPRPEFVPQDIEAKFKNLDEKEQNDHNDQNE